MIADAALRFTFYDCLALFCLTLSLCLRGNDAAESSIGCIFVALFSATTWAIVRELVLGGSARLILQSDWHLIAMLSGTCVGAVLCWLRKADGVSQKIEVVTCGLLCCFGFLCALPHLGVWGALFFTFNLTICPSFLCDVALGDIARFVHDSGLMLRAMVGACVCCAVYFLSPYFFSAFSDLLALGAGVFVTCFLQYLRA